MAEYINLTSQYDIGLRDLRWKIVADTNWDGEFTVSDIGGIIEYVFYVPGDFVLWLLMHYQDLSRFLELHPSDYGNGYSLILSIAGWFIGVLVLPLLAWAEVTGGAT